MKEKFLDMDTDWEIIKNTQLQFLVDENIDVAAGGDARTAGLDKKAALDVDPREAMLRALVGMA